MLLTRRTTVAEARQLQNVGEWVPNPKYNPTNTIDLNAQAKLLFRAQYMVTYRPNMSAGPFADDDPAIVEVV